MRIFEAGEVARSKLETMAQNCGHAPGLGGLEFVMQLCRVVSLSRDSFEVQAQQQTKLPETHRPTGLRAYIAFQSIKKLPLISLSLPGERVPLTLSIHRAHETRPGPKFLQVDSAGQNDTNECSPDIFSIEKKGHLGGATCEYVLDITSKMCDLPASFAKSHRFGAAGQPVLINERIFAASDQPTDLYGSTCLLSAVVCGRTTARFRPRRARKPNLRSL